MASQLQVALAVVALLSFLALPISSQMTSNIASATFIGSPTPTSINGDSKYTLLGCYVEPPTTSNHRALGPPGTYITPEGLDPKSMTVEQCLQACTISLGSSGADAYPYAGLENTNECYCSPVFLTNATHIVSSGFCTSPCTGNTTTSCGGYGYVDIYQITSNINTGSSSLRVTSLTATTFSTQSSSHSSPTTSLSSTSLGGASTSLTTSTSSPIASNSSKPSLSGGAIAGIVIGSIVGILLLLFLIFCLRRRYQKKKGSEPTGPQPVSIVDSPGFVIPDSRRNGIIYPSDSVSPKPWEVRDPQHTPSHPSQTPTQPSTQTHFHTATKPLAFFRDGSQRRRTFERWKSGDPSELEGDGDQSAVGTYNDEDLLEGFNETGGRDRVMSWRVGDDEDLKRRYDYISRPNDVVVGQDRAELSGMIQRENVIESPILGRSGQNLRDLRVESSEDTGTNVSALSATGGWSPREAAGRREKAENQFGVQEKLG